MAWVTFVLRGTPVAREACRTKGKACFRRSHGRSVDDARDDPHPSVTARQPFGPPPNDHTPTTAFRAGSDKHEHDDQDRRTT
ncbi:hypothetical protein BX257_5862 [Streptomyces sp. 3212.3]|nr:hypothetical protein BX257_5862 [Streptomyces sp. 3212.3]